MRRGGGRGGVPGRGGGEWAGGGGGCHVVDFQSHCIGETLCVLGAERAGQGRAGQGRAGQGRAGQAGGTQQGSSHPRRRVFDPNDGVLASNQLVLGYRILLRLLWRRVLRLLQVETTHQRPHIG